MHIRRLVIEGYRSVRKLSIPLENLNVFVGENGAGKTNLYRALELVHGIATGTIAHDLAAEGGMESTYWAGTRKPTEPVRIKLGVELQGNASGQYVSEIELGLKTPTGAGFLLEPQIKSEKITFLGSTRPEVILERRNTFCKVRDEEGLEHEIDIDFLPSETALANIQEPDRFPDLTFVRDVLCAWRFFHNFSTDLQSPLRQPCLAVTSPMLASDGTNLAAVFATLAHIRQDTVDLDETINDAFPGVRLIIPPPERMASFGLQYREFPKRVFEASELSDGTLRFLALAAALLSYRPPRFIALNEPETSLHPELLPALGRLIVRASEHTQMWIVTHSELLAETIAAEAGITPRHVIKKKGETKIEGLTFSGEYKEP